jgi:hypothetical protein
MMDSEVGVLEPDDASTPHDHLLYLLAELEQALVRGDIEWSGKTLAAARQRVVHVLSRLALARLPPHRMNSQSSPLSLAADAVWPTATSMPPETLH